MILAAHRWSRNGDRMALHALRAGGTATLCQRAVTSGWVQLEVQPEQIDCRNCQRLLPSFLAPPEPEPAPELEHEHFYAQRWVCPEDCRDIPCVHGELRSVCACGEVEA
jgi:hypothetical protein